MGSLVLIRQISGIIEGANAPAIADIFVAVSLSLLVIYFKKKNK